MAKTTIWAANLSDELIHGSDGRCLTVEEWLDAVPDMPESSYILFLNILFPRLYPVLQQRGYLERKKLMPIQNPCDRYAIAIHNNAVTSLTIEMNGVRHKFVEFGKLIEYRNPYDPIFMPDDEEFAAWLVDNGTPPSPVFDGQQLLGHREWIIQPEWDSFSPALKIAIKTACLNPALMGVTEEGYGFHECVYDYDCNSMYPYILSKLRWLPDMAKAVYYKELPTDVPLDQYCLCETPQRMMEMLLPTDVVPLRTEGWLVPVKGFQNPWAYNMFSAYEKKKKLKQEGGPAYRFFKMEMNSFIGTFAQRFRRNRREIFILVTTMARRHLQNKMQFAMERGCHILAANTDGFITDRPIPNFRDSDELGGWRLDKVLHNATIYEYNRIVSDEGITLAGLPASCYDKETQSGTFYRFVQIDPHKVPTAVAVEVDLMKHYSEVDFYGQGQI